MCLERALASSRLTAEDVNYVNAHATSTQVGGRGTAAGGAGHRGGRSLDPYPKLSTQPDIQFRKESGPEEWAVVVAIADVTGGEIHSPHHPRWCGNSTLPLGPGCRT